MVKKADGLPVTKRGILKMIAGIYDPLGLLSLILLVFQDLCTSKVEWDGNLNLVKCNLTKLTTTSLAVKRFTSLAVKWFSSLAVKRFSSLAV